MGRIFESGHELTHFPLINSLQLYIAFMQNKKLSTGYSHSLIKNNNNNKKKKNNE